MYDKKVEGLIIRARARWHEHGEKNSKYFLNLEKRNHIKKHIRKLYISGVISTGPLSIMNAQKQFYNAFWPSIGEMVVASFNEAHEAGEMSNSQRQGAITLIEKTGKDRTHLENWRPISLANVDTKIAYKVIATRITKILPEIIHSNQTGYVSGRYIGEAAKSIIDVMEYTKTLFIPGILLFIDFEKAFDSLDWNFMFKCLEIFGFGHNLVRWLETFYSNVSS